MTSLRPDSDGDLAAPREPLTFSQWVTGVVARWRVVLLGVLIVAAMAVLAVFLIPPSYSAKAAFVPNPSAPSLNLQGPMAGLRGMSGMASQLGIGRPADPSETPKFYTQLIASRELRTRLLHTRFPDPRTSATGDSARLLDMLRIKHPDPERKLELGLKTLASAMNTLHDEETNLVRLTVSSEWRHLSAQVANRTLQLVTEFNREQRSSRARSKRDFLNRRTAVAYSELQSMEARQRAFKEQNRSYRTSPTLELQEQQLQREVDRAADLYLALQTQLETARIEEVNDAALITVVDSAVAPRKAAWPRYGILTVTTLFAGGVFGTMLAGLLVVLADWRRRNPASASQLKGTIRNATRELTGRSRSKHPPPGGRVGSGG